jgi:hypothetical protein
MDNEQLIRLELEHLYHILDAFEGTSQRLESEIVIAQIKELEAILKLLKETK